MESRNLQIVHVALQSAEKHHFRSFSPGADSPMGSYWARGSENLKFWKKQPKMIAIRAQCVKELTKNNQDLIHNPQKVTTNTERRILLNTAFLNLKWPQGQNQMEKKERKCRRKSEEKTPKMSSN